MNRNEFLKTMAVLPFGIGGVKEFYQSLKERADSDTKMPALFIGHGSPMNAIQNNSFTQALQKAGESLPRPKAIMVVSAHWLTRGTYVSVSEKPDIIYDFSGFPKEMYDIKYSVPGATDFASMTTTLSKEKIIMPDHEWGIDHGAWTVLLHMFPKADIPVYQLSLDLKMSMQAHFDLAQLLKALRKKGVLVIGSGNITHNLRQIDYNVEAKVFDWALEFDSKIVESIERRDFIPIINYEKWGNISKLAHPSNDHFLPLLYSLGLVDKNDEIRYLYEGFHHGSLSMRCIQIG